MTELLVAALCFVGLHLFVAGTSLRDRLVRALGEGRYLLLFSLASVAGISWLCVAYSSAYAGDQNRLLFDLGVGVSHAMLPLMLLSLLLVVMGLLSPNPTAVGQDRKLGEGFEPVGVQRITRHPFLWGAALWAGGHLLVNGDAASAVLFGCFLLLTLAGTRSIDRKLLKRHGHAYQRYLAVTSNLPFGAVLTRRTRLVLSEFSWRNGCLALLIYTALVFAHPFLFGASPLPGTG